MRRILSVVFLSVFFVFAWLQIDAATGGSGAGSAYAAPRIVQPCDPGVEDEPFFKP